MSKFLGSSAADIYGVRRSRDEIQSLIPRSKFQFTTTMQYLDPSSDLGFSTLHLSRISSVDMPSHRITNDVLNQYNKKRIVQTGIEYNPITISVYDTADAYIETFLKKYHAYYYRNLMTVDDPNKFYDDRIGEGFIGDFSGMGYKLQVSKNMIQRMTIERKSSPEDISITTLFNPMIIDVQADTLDYSDSNPVQYKLVIAYEGYDVTTVSE